MTREDIEKAALKGVEEYVNSGNLKGFRGSYCKGFMEYADWRINSVWHDDISKGETRKVILVQFDNGLFNLFEDIRDLKGIEDKVKAFAYIEDLIPDKEE